jgi:hypothetical protein
MRAFYDPRSAIVNARAGVSDVCDMCGNSGRQGHGPYCPRHPESVEVQNPSMRQPPVLSVDSQERKDTPIYSGVLAYFPRALAYIAKVSKAGNDKHNPGQPLHWSKDKSNDHADCVARHLIENGETDPEDGLRHSGKLAWRALALLEIELENAES